MAAEARKPIRISGLMRGMLYALAVRKSAEAAGFCPNHRRIPMPGLPQPESQLSVPLLVRGELVGVLCIESEMPYRFHEEDKTAIELLGSYLAIAVQNMLLRERAESADAEPAAPPRDAVPGPSSVLRREIAFYGRDDVIMVDGDYLIRGLPARIFWKLLRLCEEQRRTEFTNRELRLDRTLNLPEWKDNLETRLLLLRRRLEQKCPDIRIVPRARGRFALELACQVKLAERA